MHALRRKTACTGRETGTWATVLICICLMLSACATPAPQQPVDQAQIPLQRGWFEGKTVFYITTDVSDAAVAEEKKANFAPRLAYALPAKSQTSQTPQTPQPSSVDKVYAFTNIEQGNVFASAPLPMGHANREAAYSPLWLMLTVTWKAGTNQRVLKSEEEVLDAAEKGWVAVASTGVIVNCPIVHRGELGGLPGVTIKAP
jgi:hypothetical protein